MTTFERLESFVDYRTFVDITPILHFLFSQIFRKLKILTNVIYLSGNLQQFQKNRGNIHLEGINEKTDIYINL